MPRFLLLFLAAVIALAADDPWTKVREIKSGTDPRIYKKASTQPILAKMDEATDENLLVVIKNRQTAIPRDQIDRLDYRPKASRVTKETKTTTTAPDPAPGPPGSVSATPGTSTTSSLSVGSLPDFETIYRRPSPAPKK